MRVGNARQLIALHYEMGARAGALDMFERYVTRLYREAGVEPMPETPALQERILRNQKVGQ